MVTFRREEMSSQQGRGGTSWLFDYGAEDEAGAADYIWASQIVDDPAIASTVAGFDVSHKGSNRADGSSSRKRNRTESSAEPGTKACREKMRRDRLNDRFLELSSILEPGKPPKSDKFAILSDATRRLKQLHLEVKMLKESNEALQGSIKSIKVEKAELRDEKVRLKAEKERMEQVLKSVSSPTPFTSHAAVATAYHPATFTTFGKTVSSPSCPPVSMWQWIPPAVLDTSQDHVLRPPVA